MGNRGPARAGVGPARDGAPRAGAGRTGPGDLVVLGDGRVPPSRRRAARRSRPGRGRRADRGAPDLLALRRLGTRSVPGILWSDRRASEEAAQLAGVRGVEDGDASAPGGPLDAASVAAKVAWLAGHRPAELASAVWMLTPRDLVAWRMTGEVVTDTTMASPRGSTTRPATWTARWPARSPTGLRPRCRRTPWSAPSRVRSPNTSVSSRGPRWSSAPATARARCSAPVRPRRGRWSAGGRPPTSRFRWKVHRGRCRRREWWRRVGPTAGGCSKRGSRLRARSSPGSAG